MSRYHVTVFGKDHDATADLVRKYKVDVFHRENLNRAAKARQAEVGRGKQYERPSSGLSKAANKEGMLWDI